MLILVIKAGENALADCSRAVSGSQNGDIHVAMLASNQFRVYIEGGMLPDDEDDAHFDTMKSAFDFAIEVARLITEEYI